MSIWSTIKTMFGLGKKEEVIPQPTPILSVEVFPQSAPIVDIKPDVEPSKPTPVVLEEVTPQPAPIQVEVSLDPFFFEMDAFRVKLDRNQKSYFAKLVKAYNLAASENEKTVAKLKIENYMTKIK